MKMKKLFKKYGLLFLLGILTLGVLITTIVVLFNSEDMKSYEGELFSVNYDSTWKVKSKKAGLLELVHRKSKSTLVIEETSLKDEYQYFVIDELIDELSYSISDQNKGYKLLSKDKAQVGKDNSDGYKLLYEDDKSQIMVIITKNGSKLRLFTYSAKYEYFDMVLDSAYNIIDSYESTEGKTGTKVVKVNTGEVSWGSNDEYKKLASKTKSEEIANYNYKVKFEVPEDVKKSSLSTTSLSFNYNSLELSIYAYVFSNNIYEFVNSEDGSVYSDKKARQKRKDMYSNIKDGLMLQDIDGKKRYVYKMTYDVTLSGGTDHMEYVVILYELDKNHVAKFKIESKKTIPIELINSIKVKSYENYANNVSRKIEDGKLVNELKAYKESRNDMAYVIKIKLPVEYQEQDHNIDMFTTRSFGKNYNEDYLYYMYDVEYCYMFSSEKGAVDNVKSTYNSYKSKNGYQNLRESGTIIVNNKKFLVFDGGYYESVFSVIGSKQVFSNIKYLIHEAGNKYLVIEVIGNGVQISNDYLNEITNFEVEERKEKR